MKGLFVTFLFVFAVLSLSMLAEPTATYAAEPLVTCNGVSGAGGGACTLCSVFEMIDRIIRLLFSLLAVIAVLMLAAAGLKLVISAGNPTAMQAAKETITNVVIGFVIVLAAWLIVDTVFKMLTFMGEGSNGGEIEWGPWNEFNKDSCGTGVQNAPGAPAGGAMGDAGIGDDNVSANFDWSRYTNGDGIVSGSDLSHDQIRIQARNDNPNVRSTFSGTFGSLAHRQFIIECNQNSGEPVLQSGSTSIVECRTGQ